MTAMPGAALNERHMHCPVHPLLKLPTYLAYAKHVEGLSSIHICFCFTQRARGLPSGSAVADVRQGAAGGTTPGGPTGSGTAALLRAETAHTPRRHADTVSEKKRMPAVVHGSTTPHERGLHAQFTFI